MALNPFKKTPKSPQGQPMPAPPTVPAPTVPAPTVAAPVAPPAEQAPEAAVPAEAGQPAKKSRFRRGSKGAPSLKKQRDQLAADFAKAQYDLGGLVYEMGLRKDYRTDVLDNRVEILQRIDGQLAESERVMKLDEAGAAGNCPSCGAMHARNAGFCWQCGGALAGGPPAPTEAPAPVPPTQPAPPVVPPPGTPQV